MIGKIIVTFLLLAMGILFFIIGNSIQNEGDSTVEFCKQHYRNESFMATVADNEPYEVIGCESKKWRTGWYQYCNKTCFELVDKCLEERATEEQVRFTQQCHWMGVDYLTIAGSILFRIFLPLICLVLIWNEWGGHNAAPPI